MAVKLRLWWCLLFAFAMIICSARNTISLSGNEMVVKEGRSLKARTDDYNDPSANRKHDPKNKVGSSSRSHKSRATP